MHSHPLPRELFSRIDESPDELFYAAPRLVTHIHLLETLDRSPGPDTDPLYAVIGRSAGGRAAPA